MSSLHSTAAGGSNESNPSLEGGSLAAPTSSSSSIVADDNSSTSIVHVHVAGVSTGLDTTNGNVRSPSDIDLSDGDGRPLPPSDNGEHGEQRVSAASLLLARNSDLAYEADDELDGDGSEEDSEFTATDGYNTYNTNGGSSYNRTESSTNGGSVLAAASDRGALLSIDSNSASPSGPGPSGSPNSGGGNLGSGSLKVAAADADGRGNIDDDTGGDDIAADEDEKEGGSDNGGNIRADNTSDWYWLEDQRKLHLARREAATSKPLDGRPPTTLREMAYFREATIFGHKWTMEIYFKYFAYDPDFQKYVTDHEAKHGAPLLLSSPAEISLHVSIYLVEVKGAETPVAPLLSSGGSSSPNGAGSGSGSGSDLVVRANDLSEEGQRAREEEDTAYRARRKAATSEPLNGPPFTPNEFAYFREACFYKHAWARNPAWARDILDKYITEEEDEPMLEKLVKDDEARHGGAPLSDDDFDVFVSLYAAKVYHPRRAAATIEPLDGPPTTSEKRAYFRDACMYGHPWTLEFYDQYLADDPMIQKLLEDHEAKGDAPLSSNDLVTFVSRHVAKGTEICSACGKEGYALEKCSACQCVWYCDKDCRDGHSVEHTK